MGSPPSAKSTGLPLATIYILGFVVFGFGPLVCAGLGCDTTSRATSTSSNAALATTDNASQDRGAGTDSGGTGGVAPSSTPALPATELPTEGTWVKEARATLAKLSINPRASKPKTVTPPDQDEPHTTYEYPLPGIGDVVQSRTDAKRWSIFLPGDDSPDFFAAQRDLKFITA